MKKQIGIVGCGNIGAALANAIKEKFSDRAELTAVFDIDKEKAEKLGRVLPVDKLIDESSLIIEAVSPQVVKELVPLVLEKKKEILVMSTGGLLDIPLHRGIYFPSGAIGGLDALSAAALGRIDKITLTTTKPQKSLNHNGLEKEKVVFTGTVNEAIKAYPKNINVCATLALVCGRPDLITVKIIACPVIKKNKHQIDIEGDFGKISCKFENEPSPENPKTSYLAILSAIDTLRKILYG